MCGRQGQGQGDHRDALTLNAASGKQEYRYRSARRALGQRTNGEFAERMLGAREKLELEAFGGGGGSLYQGCPVCRGTRRGRCRLRGAKAVALESSPAVSPAGGEGRGRCGCPCARYAVRLPPRQLGLRQSLPCCL